MIKEHLVHQASTSESPTTRRHQEGPQNTEPLTSNLVATTNSRMGAKGADTMPQHVKGSGTSQSTFMTEAKDSDPYRYQTGFGNVFTSEAIPGTIPRGQNTPQRIKYDLYSEQLNGTSFVSPRSTLQHVWFYRILPSVAHGDIKQCPTNENIVSTFSAANDNAEFVPHALCWLPFKVPDGSGVDFVGGLKTICGQGDPTTKEGVAVHIYTANSSMQNRAFCNNDGDLLILPQCGRLDIQTEMGRMMVKPGELAVVQAGIRFRVSLPDGVARGYIQEVFGCHYELPELGPIGSNGMALPRDFEVPVASFDMDTSEWEIVYKLAGKLWSCCQNHTPFDVVAWHGNYAPYKYDSSRFVPSAVVDRDQSDPSIFTVLTAKSKIPGVSMSDVVMFTPKWNVAKGFRLPYYHRNMATEILGIVHGQYKGSSRDLRAGGLSIQSSYMAHGETHEAFIRGTTDKLQLERVGEDSLLFMLHISTHCAVTKFALEQSGVLCRPQSSIWNSMKGHFFDHLHEVNAELRKRGLEPICQY